MDRRPRLVPFRTAFLALALAASALSGRSQTPDSFVWQTSTPEAQGVDPAPIQQMVARIQNDGMRVHGFVLVKNGYIVAENYWGGYTRDSRHILYSVSKSFTSACFGIAKSQGLIGGLDQRLLDIYSDRTVANLNEFKRALTLRNLLTMSTGHEQDSFSALTGSSDWVQTFLNLPCTFQPGTRFSYDSGGTMMLSATVQRQSGMNLLAFAERYLFAPIGILSNYSWDAGPGNVTAGGWGLSLTPRDMARFGLLYLNRGVWQGRQVVPASWVDESSRRQIANGTEGPWGSGYGYQFWLNDFGGYRADGYGGQYIFILPDANAVAVFTAGYTDGTATMGLMSTYIAPALRTGNELPGVSRADGFPTIHLAPASTIVTAGDEADFHVVATGGGLRYQWSHDGTTLPGETTDTLRVRSASATDAGSYAVRITNAYGSVDSATVTLALAERDNSARLTNLSARARAGSGENTLIIGLIASGSGPDSGMPCLIRALGPTLSSFGIASPLENPSAVLYQGSNPIQANTDWHGNDVIRDCTARIGGYQLDASSRDAALHTVLRPGAYTLHVTSDSGSGIALGECYQGTAAPAAGSAKLVNLSARAGVTSGEGALIAGFIVSGEGQKQVLIRAVGPSLAQYGVSGYLMDPVLTLRDGSRTTLASNDDWRGTQELSDAIAEMGAFPLPNDSTEAVILATLPAGAYTAELSAKAGASGVALIEIYSK
ncbi:hypothetical protein DB347_05565 [Opitutaceae bacterium EW11]|nr:hypothetical protein DB347_05565 [Opitutaceae bacterium EW11]